MVYKAHQQIPDLEEIPPLIDDDGGSIEYTAKNGDVLIFDISQKACQKHGFEFGNRVETLRGLATVVGVRHNCLWFHIDGDPGASFWDNAHNYEDLVSLGIKLAPPEIEPDIGLGEYRIKKVQSPEGEPIAILMQNENGPCPLIALCNVLTLRGLLRLDGGKYDRITSEGLIHQIASSLRKKYHFDDSFSSENVQEAVNSMQVLQYGMDINFSFSNCDSIESTQNTKIFQMFGIRIVHGWIVDPSTQAASVIQNQSYNDITLQLAALQEKTDKKQSSNTINMINSPSSPSSSKSHPVNSPSNTNTNTNSNSNPSEKTSSDGSDVKILSKEEGIILGEFLELTCQQLTQVGLNKLKETCKNGEIAIFFRNNHFSTLIKYEDELYTLVTDIGYEKESQIVWELLSLDGDSVFLSGTFFSLEELKQQEIVRNTASEFGFFQIDIECAIRACQKKGKQVEVDDVLLWLSENVGQI